MANPLKKILAFIYSILERSYWSDRYDYYRRRYSIHPSFRFNGEGIRLYGDGEIICGKNSYIGRFSSIQCAKGCKVTIGSNTSISHYVMVYTSNLESNQDMGKTKAISKGNVKIGNDCWVGARVFIKEGITIGNNSVIGASAVVTHNIPDNSVAAGVPAKIISKKIKT